MPVRTMEKQKSPEIRVSKNPGCSRYVLVGTYKKDLDQLKWIGKHHLYNYPLSAEEAQQGNNGNGWRNVKELWLYSGLDDTRHIYEAEFIGLQSREDFLAKHPDYPKGRKKHGDSYAVFGVKHKSRPMVGDFKVIARVPDFVRWTPKIAKAIEAYRASGDLKGFGDYLPAELGSLSSNQMCVCEASVQLNLFHSIGAMPSANGLNVISMFSGAMGLDNGIEKAGLNIRLCVEIQHAMAETIRANKPEIPVIEDDVRNYTGADLRAVAGIKKNEDVFLVCGGPPCQAFSTAGKRLGFDDDRGNVFLKYIDLIGEIRPKYFLLENVRGLLSASYTPPTQEGELSQDGGMKGSALLYALEQIKKIGYSATFTLYDTANYGVPQKRERVIILGSREGYKIPLIPPTHSATGKNGLKKWRTFRNAVKGLKKCTAAPIPNKRLKYFQMLGPGEYWKDLPEDVQKEAMGKSFDLPGGKTGFYRRLAWDEPSPTLVTCPTMPATDLMHPEENRALSIEEYARIQMFPDKWRFIGSMADIYKQIGNAVPVGMGYAAAKHLLWFDSLSVSQKKCAKLVDPDAVYSRYKNTSFQHFEQLREKRKDARVKKRDEDSSR